MTRIMSKPERLYRMNSGDRLMAVLGVLQERWLIAAEGLDTQRMQHITRWHQRLLNERAKRLYPAHLAPN